MPVLLSYYPGLLLMGYRWYNPSLGRFWTRDPQGYEGGINLYDFCRSNPLNHSDPMELQATETTHIAENTAAYVSSGL